MAEGVFRYGPSERLVLCSPTVLSAFSRLGLGDVRLTPESKMYGIAVKEYITPHGTFYLVKHDFLTGTTYGGYGIVLDMEQIRFRPMRKTRLERNIHDNDYDGVQHQYLSEVSLEVRLPKHHGYFYGVTG